MMYLYIYIYVYKYICIYIYIYPVLARFSLPPRSTCVAATNHRSSPKLRVSPPPSLPPHDRRLVNRRHAGAASGNHYLGRSVP